MHIDNIFKYDFFIKEDLTAYIEYGVEELNLIDLFKHKYNIEQNIINRININFKELMAQEFKKEYYLLLYIENKSKKQLNVLIDEQYLILQMEDRIVKNIAQFLKEHLELEFNGKLSSLIKDFLDEDIISRIENNIIKQLLNNN